MALTAFFGFAWATTGKTRDGIIHHGIRTTAGVTSVYYDQCGVSPCDTPVLNVIYEVDGRSIRSNVSPNDSGNWTPGQRIPVIYDALHLTSAFYAGPGGDAYGGPTVAMYAGLALASGALTLLVVLGLADRWLALGAAVSSASAPTRRRLTVTIHGRDVLAPGAFHGQPLAWRLMAHQDPPAGATTGTASGLLTPGGLVVLGLGDTILWPASRAKVRSAIQPISDPARLERAHDDLLAAYTEALTRAENLESRISRAMVESHIAVRLHQLASAYVRARTLVAPRTPEATVTRKWLLEAKGECEDLAATIQGPRGMTARRIFKSLGSLLNLAAGLLGAVGILTIVHGASRHLHVGIFVWPVVAIMGLAGIGVYGLRFYFLEKRDLLMAVRRIALAPDADERDCYQLESDVFMLLGQRKPLESQSDKRARDIFGMAVTVGVMGVVIVDGFQTGSIGEWIFDAVAILVVVVLTWYRQRRRRDKVLRRAGL